jgi:hypothetical protein
MVLHCLVEFAVFSEFNQMSCCSFSRFFLSSRQVPTALRQKGNEVYLSRLTGLGRTGDSKLKQPPILHEHDS